MLAPAVPSQPWGPALPRPDDHIRSSGAEMGPFAIFEVPTIGAVSAEVGDLFAESAGHGNPVVGLELAAPLSSAPFALPAASLLYESVETAAGNSGSQNIISSDSDLLADVGFLVDDLLLEQQQLQQNQGQLCGGGSHQPPAIDVSIFDLLPDEDEVPELEEVELDGSHQAATPTATVSGAPFETGIMFEEIPELEDVTPTNSGDEGEESVGDYEMQNVEPSAIIHSSPPAVTLSPTPSPSPPAADDISMWARQTTTALLSPSGTASEPPQFAVFAPADCGFEEEVIVLTSEAASPLFDGASSSSCAYGSCGSASPASSVYSGYTTCSSSANISTCPPPSPTSPLSARHLLMLPGGSDAEESASEKRRRVSQVSVSSFCSTASGVSGADWSPASSYASSGSSSSHLAAGSSSDSDYCPTASGSKTSAAGGGPIRRATGGGRRSRFSPEDRRERKKAQNRTAAERYRQKKREEEDVVGGEEKQLSDANGELRLEVTRLEAELSCLKGLMREMLLAKGIKIPPKPSADASGREIGNISKPKK